MQNKLKNNNNLPTIYLAFQLIALVLQPLFDACQLLFDACQLLAVSIHYCFDDLELTLQLADITFFRVAIIRKIRSS